MKNIVDDVLALVKENEILKEQLSEQKQNTIFVEKFYNVGMTTDVVASLHSVSSALVRKYVKEGLIDVHPLSTDAKILIRASDALRLDFKQLKRELSLRYL